MWGGNPQIVNNTYNFGLYGRDLASLFPFNPVKTNNLGRVFLFLLTPILKSVQRKVYGAGMAGRFLCSGNVRLRAPISKDLKGKGKGAPRQDQ